MKYCKNLKIYHYVNKPDGTVDWSVEEHLANGTIVTTYIGTLQSKDIVDKVRHLIHQVNPMHRDDWAEEERLYIE